MEDVQQNVTTADNSLSDDKDFVTRTATGLTYQQDNWISYCAIGGIVTDDDGRITVMSIDEFCTSFNVSRTTLWRWKKSIPNFGEKVRQRRYELYPLSRETKMWNRLYTIAMTSKDHKASVQAINMLQGHFAKLELPTQRHEVEAGNSWAALLAQRREQSKTIIEGETIIDAATSTD